MSDKAGCELHNDIERVVFAHEEIAAIVQTMGAQITEDYKDRNPLLICVLKGAVVVMADLMRAIDTPISIDFMAVSSYGDGATSSGVVRIVKDLDTRIEGRDVIIVEDILDSGLTLSYLIDMLKSRSPRSIELAAFLVKDLPDRDCPVISKYVGSHVPNEFHREVWTGLCIALSQPALHRLPHAGVLHLNGPRVDA